MAFSKKQLLDSKQKVRTGVKVSSDLLDAVTTTEDIDLGDVCSKVTFQSDGTLTGTIAFSVDGKTWSATSPLATAMTSFSTHNVCVVRLIRSGGSGRVAVAGK